MAVWQHIFNKVLLWPVTSPAVGFWLSLQYYECIAFCGAGLKSESGCLLP